MSEYQYYEFVAIDRPLTGAQQDELRKVSTRGEISPTRFVNEYEWGDLKADPRVWMERHFDAHLYLANWGTHRIALRLPRAALDPATAARYCQAEGAQSWTTPTHVILDLVSEDEDGAEDWVDPHGQLAAIAQVRAELAQGDLRPLYLAWLLQVQNRELGEGEPEPPVPAGLGRLSGAQRALADFLRLDADLLAAAAEASEPRMADAPSAAALRQWVKGLRGTEKDELLLRLLQGNDELLRAEMLRRFQGTIGNRPADGSRTVGELLADGEKARAQRQDARRKRDAAERLQKEEAAAAARAARLATLARNPASAWKQVDALLETRRGKEYEAAVTLLKDLHSLDRAQDVATFATGMRRLRQEHRRKPSLISRFDDAGLP